MAEYSTAQMEESLAEEEIVPAAAPRPWRRAGMVAAALGTVGAVFGMTRPQQLTTLQKMKRVAHVGHSFMQAVVKRALDDEDDGITVDVTDIFAPAGMDEFPGVSAQFYLRPAEDEDAETEFRVTFVSKEGAGEDLQTQLQKVIDSAKDHCLNPPEEGPSRRLQEEGDCDMFDQIKLEDGEEDGLVDLVLTPPADMLGEEEDKLEEGMAAKPTLELKVQTGRTVDEMVEAMHGCPWTLPGGLSITANTKLATALLNVVDDMSEQVLDPHESSAVKQAMQAKKVFEAFSSFSLQSETRYNPEKFEAAICDNKESKQQKQQIEFIKGALPYLLVPMLGEETVKAAAGLGEFADHVKSIRFSGSLPANYEIYAEFDNFAILPVVSELLQLPEPEDSE